MKDTDLTFVLLQMSNLVTKFGQKKAMAILDCITAIHKATENIPDDIKQDAFQWVLDLSKQSLPVSKENIAHCEP